VLATVLIGVLAAPGAARAESTPSELALARRLFSEATTLESARDWSAAAAKLREALAIKETPGLRYHLAHCEEQSGALVAASLEYARASELIAEGAQAPDVAQLLALADQRLAASIPTLSLHVPSGVEGVTVTIDDHSIPTPVLDNPVPLDPGSHQVLARAPNRPAFSRAVELLAGQSKTLDLEFDPIPSGPTAAAETLDDRSSAPERSGISPPTVALLVEGAFAVAGLGVGIGFAVTRSHAAERAVRAQQAVDEQAPPGTVPCGNEAPAPVPACSELDQAIADHHRDTAFMVAGFVTAGVAVTAGVLTFALWPDRTERLAVSFEPGGAILIASGRF